MDVLIFCAILSFSSSLAFEVSFNTVDLKVRKFNWPPVLVCTKHEFVYHRDDEFKIHIQLMNKSLDVNYACAIVRKSGVPGYVEEFWFEGITMLHIFPTSDTIKIDLELVVNNSCVRKTILEGREASTTMQKGTNITAFKYNNICIYENECFIRVDPTRECKDEKLSLPCAYAHEKAVPPADDQRSKTANKTKNNQETSRVNDDSQKDQKLSPLPREHRQYVHEEALLLADVQQSKTANKTKNNQETSRANDDSPKGAENTYFIIMIVTSIISAVALALLLVIAIRHGCWISNLPLEPQTLPTNLNPFYENVHLRAECQKKIEEPKQRVYDLPAENEYEEIRNHS